MLGRMTLLHLLRSSRASRVRASEAVRLLVRLALPWCVADALDEENYWTEGDPCALLAMILSVALGKRRHSVAAAIILLMLTGGNALEEYAFRRAGRGLRQLLSRLRTHEKTWQVCRDGTDMILTADNVRNHDVLLLREGDMVPVDGVCMEDALHTTTARPLLDSQAITGEKTLVAACPGDVIRSGCIVRQGAIRMRATADLASSTMGIVASEVSVALEEREQAPLERRCASAATWMTPAAVGLAVLAFQLRAWRSRGKHRLRAWETSLAVLMSATPCPLIIGVPVAFLSATSGAAENGISLKSSGALERVAGATTVVLDKTGTLTEGVLSLLDVQLSCKLSQKSHSELVHCLAALELAAGSAHPIVDALCRARDTNPVPNNAANGDRILDASVEPGHGMRGKILVQETSLLQEIHAATSPSEELVFVFGSHDYVSAHCSSIRDQDRRGAPPVDLPTSGSNITTTVWLSIQQVSGHTLCCGTLRFMDQVRPGARQFVQRLQRSCKVMILSGDGADSIAAVAKHVGISEPGHAMSCLPQEKARVIKDLEADGERVVMIGDGANDVAALSTAAVGVAVGSSDWASCAADVTIRGERPFNKILKLLEAARSTLAIARRGVVAGAFLSCLQMILAAVGLIPPAFCAALQELVDLASVLNAMLASRKAVWQLQNS